jgi:hypothetical protein
MILSLTAPSGTAISRDLRKQLGDSVELQCFSFVTPPLDFRLMRGDVPLQTWQAGNTDMYDLQHCPGVNEWDRDDHCFANDLDHRQDVLTCGVLSKDLIMETRGLGFHFVLLIWPREGTVRRDSSLGVMLSTIHFEN